MTLEEAKDIVLFSIIRGKEGYTSRCAECEKLVEAIGLVVVDMLEKMPSWISVNDRLPEKAGTYLVATRNGAVTITHFYLPHQTFSSQRINRLITHWMPLPDPPKEEKHAFDNPSDIIKTKGEPT